MANFMTYLQFIIPLFIYTLPLLQSRSITTPHKSPKTTVLNVTASIENTHKALAFDLQRRRSLPSSSSSPTQNIYDYKMLTLSRLERDSARVESILTRLDQALNPETSPDSVISGTSQGSGDYFVRVGIGNPPSYAYLVLDTGNDVSWIQCKSCDECYSQADPIFEPASSASYKPLSCQARQCKELDAAQCNSDKCLYSVSYSDGSYTVGDFVTETLTLGSDSVSGLAIGCGHSNEGVFFGAAGLLGLGGGSLSLPAQLNASSFSYCLANRDSDSASTLEFDTPTPLSAVITPLRRNLGIDTFYYVELSGVVVGGELLPIPELDADGIGGTILDSGTAVTWLPSEVYDRLRYEFVTFSDGLPSARSVGLFDTCYDLSSLDSVEVPTVSFYFPAGQELSLPAKDYLVPVDSEGTFCLAFAPTPRSSTLTVIGNVQQQGTRVSFDLANSLIGLTANSC